MSFFRETPIKATRKDHHCECCQTTIEAGSPAVYMAGLSEDNDLWAGHAHTDCRAAECEWNRERGTHCGDEWEMLYMIREDDEAEDWEAWLRAEWPVVASRIYRKDQT